jgi:hypothetical protein
VVMRLVAIHFAKNAAEAGESPATRARERSWAMWNLALRYAAVATVPAAAATIGRTM